MTCSGWRQHFECHHASLTSCDFGFLARPGSDRQHFQQPMKNILERLSLSKCRVNPVVLCGLMAVSLAATARAEVLLETGDGQVRLEDGHLQLLHGGAVVADVQSIDFNFKPPKSLAVGPRAADHVTLHAVYPSVAKYRDEIGDLPVDIEIEAVAGGFRFHAQ